MGLGISRGTVEPLWFETTGGGGVLDTSRLGEKLPTDIEIDGWDECSKALSC